MAVVTGEVQCGMLNVFIMAVQRLITTAVSHPHLHAPPPTLPSTPLLPYPHLHTPPPTLSSTPLLPHPQTVSSDVRRGSDGYNLDTLSELQREALFIPRSNLDSFQQIGEGSHFEPVPCIVVTTVVVRWV